MSQRSWYMLILSILFLCICGYMHVAAEEIQAYDCRNSAREFGKQVAQIDGVSGFTERGDGTQHTRILFQSDHMIDFSGSGLVVYSVVYGPGGFAVLTADQADGAVTWLRMQQGVRFAEPDEIVSGCSTEQTGAESESGSGSESQLSFHSYGVQLSGLNDYIRYAAAWGTGSAVVAVIDSGVYRHSLISSRLGALGYDYVDRDNDPTNDLNGHGTRVAGIISDCSQSLPVYIYPIRVLDENADGKLSNVVCGVLEAIEAGVDVINLSLSTYS